MNKNYIDIGINLTNKQFRNGIDETIQNAISKNVNTMILTGTSVKASLQSFDLVQKHKNNLYSTAGIHPHNAKEFNSNSMDELRKLLKNKEVISVGECGLDFNRDFSPRKIQELCFEAHLQLASEVNKPLFLHERSAFERFNAILDNHKNTLPKSVVHCFTGELEEVKTYVNKGFYIGFTGAISDSRRFNQLKEVVNYVPLDRIMIETDSPFMLPKNIPNNELNKQNKRRNEPAFLPYVAETIAKFKRISVEEVAFETQKNTDEFFGI